MTINDKVLKSFGSKNVLVTGGTGMIGRQVVNILEDVGASIRIVSLNCLKISDKAEHVLGDLTDLEFCKKVTKDMEGNIIAGASNSQFKFITIS